MRSFGRRLDLGRGLEGSGEDVQERLNDDKKDDNLLPEGCIPRTDESDAIYDEAIRRLFNRV